MHILDHNVLKPTSQPATHAQDSEEEEVEEEEEEEEEQEQRKVYQLRERRPIQQSNLYKPSFGGQGSRHALHCPACHPICAQTPRRKACCLMLSPTARGQFCHLSRSYLQMAIGTACPCALAPKLLPAGLISMIRGQCCECLHACFVKQNHLFVMQRKEASLCRRSRLLRGSQKSRHVRKAHRPTYAEDWSDDDVLDHPAVAWKSLQVTFHCLSFATFFHCAFWPMLDHPAVAWKAVKTPLRSASHFAYHLCSCSISLRYSSNSHVKDSPLEQH